MERRQSECELKLRDFIVVEHGGDSTIADCM